MDFYPNMEGLTYKEIECDVSTSRVDYKKALCRLVDCGGNTFRLVLPTPCESVEYRKLNDLVTVALLKAPHFFYKKYTSDREVFDSIRRTGYRKSGRKVEVVRSIDDGVKEIKITLA
jgi:hypothetical protein